MVWPMGAIVAWTTIISFALTSAARRVAPRAGFVDCPDGSRKQHQAPTPLLGGVAILLALLSGWCLPAVLGWEPQQRLELPRFPLGSLAVSACLFCVLGLWDDRWGLRPRAKFGWQIAACLPFVLWGDVVESIEVGGWDLPLGAWGPLFTVFWLVACVNIINLVDGLDGLAGSLGLVILATLALLCLMSGRIEAALAALVVAGALSGFLIHNWPPAKIFMGDAGSLTMGFVIGALSIESSLKQATGFALIAPLAMICLPVFDTAMAILRRKLSGRSLGQADRRHIHHRLQDRGLNRLQVLLVLTSLTVITSAAAIASVYFQHDLIAVAVCLLTIGLLIAGRVFGHLESWLCLAHLRELFRLVADTRRSLAARMLMARLPHITRSEPQDAWTQLSVLATQRSVQRMDFACVQHQTDTVLAQLVWRSGPRTQQGDNVWEFQVTVQRDARTVATLRMVGTCQGQGERRRHDDLLLLADRFCRAWPIDVSEEQSDVVTFPGLDDGQAAVEESEAVPIKDSYRHAA